MYNIGEKPIVILYVFMDVCMVIPYSKGMDQPGKVANPACGQVKI